MKRRWQALQLARSINKSASVILGSPFAEQSDLSKTATIAPRGFASVVMRENVFVGTAMKRRSVRRC